MFCRRRPAKPNTDKIVENRYIYIYFFFSKNIARGRCSSYTEPITDIRHQAKPGVCSWARAFVWALVRVYCLCIPGSCCYRTICKCGVYIKSFCFVTWSTPTIFCNSQSTQLQHDVYGIQPGLLEKSKIYIYIYIVGTWKIKFVFFTTLHRPLIIEGGKKKEKLSREKKRKKVGTFCRIFFLI